jgi:5-methylcytosine-specific restriction enzyme A
LDKKYAFTTLDSSKATNSAHTITEAGLTYLQENVQPLESLLSNNLGYIQTLDGIAKINTSHAERKKITVFDENIFISEGRKKAVSTQVYERSRVLRDRAIEVNTRNDHITCAGCGFDFQLKYGEHGQGYIEIHHQKPIFQYEESDFSKLVTEALDDLIPLCSNCHRMVHRKRDKPLSLDELKQIIGNQRQS